MKDWVTTSIAKNERKAIEEATIILKEQFPVKDIILFGSKARGDFNKYSDIDLLVVTFVPLHWKDEKAMVELLFDIGMDYDVIFSPLCVSVDEWEGDVFNKLPIYHEISKDGVMVL